MELHTSISELDALEISAVTELFPFQGLELFPAAVHLVELPGQVRLLQQQ